MVFVKLFEFIKKSSKKSKVAVKVAVAKSKVASDSNTTLHSSEGDLHVRMIFDEEGNEVAREVEHLTCVKVSGAPSVASTLVRSPVPSKSSSLIVKAKKQSTFEAAQTTANLVVAIPTAVSHPDALRTTALEADTCDAPPSPLKALVADLRVLCVLGQGSWGIVYGVQHRLTKQIFALKRISKCSTDEDGDAIFFREQHIQKQLAGNPRFVGLVASWEDDRFYNLLVDFCGGGDLQKAINDNLSMEEDQARYFAAHLIVALLELRKKGIHHRDIKPENIFVVEDKNGNVVPVIGDFGLAYQFRRTVEEQPWRKNLDWVTKEDVDEVLLGGDRLHTICGTPEYFSPQMWEADPASTVSYETDAWAIAVTIYELLHAQLPFGMEDAAEMADVARAVLHNELVVDDSVLSPEAVDFLQKTLHRDQAERLTLEEFRNHPWFDGFNWDEVEMLEREHKAFEGDAPSQANVEHIVLEEPYEDDEEPHPWFSWISPDFQTSRDSVLVSAQPSQPYNIQDETSSHPFDSPNDNSSMPIPFTSDDTDGEHMDAIWVAVTTYHGLDESSILESPIGDHSMYFPNNTTLNDSPVPDDITVYNSPHANRHTSTVHGSDTPSDRSTLTSILTQAVDGLPFPRHSPLGVGPHVGTLSSDSCPSTSCSPLPSQSPLCSTHLDYIAHIGQCAPPVLISIATSGRWWGRLKWWLATLQVAVSRTRLIGCRGGD